jgi:hypothetical protein
MASPFPFECVSLFSPPSFTLKSMVRWAPSLVNKINPPLTFKVGSTIGDFVTGVYCYSKMELGSNGVVVSIRFIVLPMKFMIMVLKSVKTTTLFVVDVMTICVLAIVYSVLW